MRIYEYHESQCPHNSGQFQLTYSKNIEHRGGLESQCPHNSGQFQQRKKTSCKRKSRVAMPSQLGTISTDINNAFVYEVEAEVAMPSQLGTISTTS